MTASAPEFSSAFAPISVPVRYQAGAATGGVRLLLRIEGVAMFAASLALYTHNGFSWLLFAVLFLSPDVAMLGYLAGPRVGAAAYNAVHTYLPALALLFAGLIAGLPAATAGALIWIAHIGFDRALGFGLKYATGFGDTHISHTARN
jgi:hypothetical protein